MESIILPPCCSKPECPGCFQPVSFPLAREIAFNISQAEAREVRLPRETRPCFTGRPFKMFRVIRVFRG
jgi:hypothetical protein